MSSSYKESSNEYKNNKKKIIDGYEDIPHKKKKIKKKNKRSNHRHEYIPAIYNVPYKKNNKIEYGKLYGEHCKICGRLKDMYYFGFYTEDKIKKFKEKYPDCVELTLPDDWDYFRNNYVPI